MGGSILNANLVIIRSCARNVLSSRKVIHSVKVGISLVLVSLLYMLNPLFNKVGENAMWAIMTVIVVFEFHAGATLGKGINRGIGTLLGAGLGCLAATLADKIGGIGNHITIASSVFIFGAAATYCRLIPRIKMRYDYGAMIFILTFSLVVVSGIRVDKVVEIARNRLATIGMGFAVCIFISVCIFPIWASNELHYSTASKFTKLATSFQGCLDEYLKASDEEKEKLQAGDDEYMEACKWVLNSKSNDQSLANYAKWEPWHGKFGLYYPWEGYLEMGEQLREVAAAIISLQQCLRSPKQPAPTHRQGILKEGCQTVMESVGFVLKELGESMKTMTQCRSKILLAAHRKSLDDSFHDMQLFVPLPSSNYEHHSSAINLETQEIHAIASFTFLVSEIVERVENLVKKVEEVGESAHFSTPKFQSLV